ncbi:MAG: SRPBCC family protein [Leptospirillia bacterium]
MGQITHTRHIRAPRVTVWEWLADYTNIHRFHPLLNTVTQETPEACGIGAVRRCDLKDGQFLRERVVDWNEGEWYRVEIFESSMPLASAFGTLGVSDAADGGSEAYMIMDYTPKFGPLGRLMDRMMMRRMMGGMMQQVLAALAQSVEADAVGPAEASPAPESDAQPACACR